MKNYVVHMEWKGGTLSMDVETDEGCLGAQVEAMTTAVREHGAKGFTNVTVKEAQ